LMQIYDLLTAGSDSPHHLAMTAFTSVQQ